MKEIKHTPGPWKVHTRKDGSQYISMGDPEHIHFAGDVNLADRDIPLIEAAPDLLEVLQEIIKYSHLEAREEVMAESAIAKATESKEDNQ